MSRRHHSFNQPVSPDEARELAEAHGGWFLGLAGHGQIAHFLCRYGHSFRTTPHLIVKRDAWCPVCHAREKELEEKHSAWRRAARQRERSRRILRLFKERFPLAFPADPAAVRPLKSGVHTDLAALLPELSPAQIRGALGLWCGEYRPYLSIASREGETRYDLYGEPCGEVNTETAARAKKRLRSLSSDRSARRRLTIYSDGSAQEKDWFTWSFAVFLGDEEIFTDSGLCRTKTGGGSIEAEIHAAVMAINWLLDSSFHHAELLCDCDGVTNIPFRNAPDTSKGIREYRRLVRPLLKRGLISFRHVEGHSNIWGNERCDGLCNLAWLRQHGPGRAARHARSAQLRAAKQRTLSDWLCRKLWQYRLKRPVMRFLRKKALILGTRLVQFAKTGK